MLQTQTSDETSEVNLKDIRCKIHQSLHIDIDLKTFQIYCKACERGIENLILEKY